jgi:hypothetical protein
LKLDYRVEIKAVGLGAPPEFLKSNFLTLQKSLKLAGCNIYHAAKTGDIICNRKV